jgi:ADP-heptose:LPS heptosyltransferase
VARLNISDRRDRATVRAIDVLLAPLGTIRRLTRRRAAETPRRILALRLERIGDFVMTMPALAALKAALPDATIDVVVGSWNADLARALAGIDRVETLDAEWLTREQGGRSMTSLLAAAAAWRSRAYDLAINFEPDVRSNLMLAASGARRLAGFASGGGGALVDVAVDFDPCAHTADNNLRLVAAALGLESLPPSVPALTLPDAAIATARDRMKPARGRTAVGVHVGGGREIKQWPPSRFADVARAILDTRDAVVVLTGSAADRPLVDAVLTTLPRERVIDVAGVLDLLPLAALLRELDAFITGDTGPMHLACAVGTPTVAIFGPSDPARYAPRGPRDRIVRVDLPCSPCNRIRLPPGRCVGHTPDCLEAVAVTDVLRALDEILPAGAPLRFRTGAGG